MRENRLSGSEGGAGNNPLFLTLSSSPAVATSTALAATAGSRKTGSATTANGLPANAPVPKANS